MSDVIILGADTDVGKTTFALLWLALFGDEYAYWKPVETGPSDTQTIRELIPVAEIVEPLCAFRAPVAPPLAARREGTEVGDARSIVASAKRKPDRAMVVETFGGPFSPLNERELQIELIRRLEGIPILVVSSALGAIGRALQCLLALEAHGIKPGAVVLLGPEDDFAGEQIRQHRPQQAVMCLQPPTLWTQAGVAKAAAHQGAVLRTIRDLTRMESPARTEPDILAKDRSFVWHPYTSLCDPDEPLVSVGAQDEFLHLADGRRVIDGISSWWTILHGHRYPPLMQALRDAAARFDHVHFAGVTHAPAVELAELLLSTAPWSGGRVFYSDNGSTAVEVALKMAYQFWVHQGEPRRTRFVGFEHGYHGDTFGAMAVGRDPFFFGTFEPLLFRADILPLSAEALDEHLTKYGNDVAAIILEPLVQGAGGMRMHTPELLRRLFEITKRQGVLFIADEVMTGGGRLGWLWAHQAAGIAPDLICAAKTLAGGMLPLAATLAAPHIAEGWETADRTKTFFHGHSFTANPLACAVALANWRLLTAAFPDAPRCFEAFWNEALGPLRGEPGVKDVRIRGTIAAVEMQAEGGYLADIGRVMRRICLEHGVVLRPLGSVLYAMPPLCASPQSLEAIARAMRAACTTARLGILANSATICPS